jgi:hypothetical protein
MATGAQFSADIGKLVAKYKTRMDDVVKQSVQELGDRIVAGTPIDTGYARASWWSSVDNSKPSHPSPPAKGQSGVKGSAGGAPAIDPADIAAAPGHVYQLKNGAAYIMKLEFGSSQMAPAGFVRISIADFPQIVAAAARQVGAK